MKRVLAAVAVPSLLVALVACSSTSEGDAGAPSSAASANSTQTQGPASEEANDMVDITTKIAQNVATYINATAPNASSEQVNAAIVKGAPDLFTKAVALSTDTAKVLTIAANQTDLNQPKPASELPAITERFTVDVLFESDYSCSAVISNVSTVPGQVVIEFDAAQALSAGLVRCGR